MRVLLLQSPTGRKEPEIFPLGLAFLAGQLEGHRVRALDLAAEGCPEGALREGLESFRPEVVAVSLRNIDDSAYPVTHSYVAPFGRLMGWLEDYGGTVLVGGTGFSIYPGRILEEHPRIDLGVAGEAEAALPRILDLMEKGELSARLREGSRLWDGRRSRLEGISPPRYDILDLSLYPRRYSVGVQSRRGCPFGCRYCTYGYLGGRSFRMRPVEDVVADVRRLGELGLESFSFVDSVFNHPAGYMRRLLRVLEEVGPGLRWSAWLDTDVSYRDMELMRRAGCDKVDFSPDALTRRGLRLLGKRGSFRETLGAVRRARELGMMVTVNLFQGNPGEEGLASLLAKLAFMIWARAWLGWSRTVVHIGTIRVYAHSPMAEDMARSGRVPGGCDFYRPVFRRSPGPADLLYRLFQWLRRRRHG
jgi:radical SAM superfamily enzyme YgiQ (UPF0313 family)